MLKKHSTQDVQGDDSIDSSEQSVAAIRDVVCGNSCKTLKSEAIDENRKKISLAIKYKVRDDIELSMCLVLIRIGTVHS